MSCRACGENADEVKKQKLIDDAKKWGKEQNIRRVALVARPNGSVFYCGADDERCTRLTVVEYLSVGC